MKSVMSRELEIGLRDLPAPDAFDAFLAECPDIIERAGRVTVTGDRWEGPYDLVIKPADESSTVRFEVSAPGGVGEQDVGRYGEFLHDIGWIEWIVIVSVPAGASRHSGAMAYAFGCWLADTYCGAVFDRQLDRVIWPKRERRAGRRLLGARRRTRRLLRVKKSRRSRERYFSAGWAWASGHEDANAVDDSLL
jgi:hypothetical protein